MATGISFWSEFRRAAFQWLSVAVAAVVSGVVLSELLLHGWTRSNALVAALVVGVVAALLPIVAIGLSFWRRSSIPIKEPVAVSAMNISGDLSIYTFQPDDQANAFSSNQIAVGH